MRSAALRHAFRLVKDVPRDRRWTQRVGAVLAGGATTTGPLGVDALGDGSVPVVMCLWNRPERIGDVLRMLDGLDPEHPVRLVLWNNNADDAALYASAVASWRDAGPRSSGSLRSVDLVQSPENFGGLGRFIVARLLWNAGYRGPLVTLDDDQDVSPSFVADLRRDWTRHSVIPWWGFKLHGSYWRRSEIPPGAEPDHAGTGGTMLDVELVADDRFFVRLPHRYAYLEDQWMTFVARAKGWRIVKARTDIALVSEEKNQYHGLKPLKDVFYVWQRTVGRFWLGLPARRPAWDRGRLRGGR